MAKAMMHAYRDFPALREQRFSVEEQVLDGNRVRWVFDLWRSQDWALQHRDRQIEENIVKIVVASGGNAKVESFQVVVA